MISKYQDFSKNFIQKFYIKMNLEMISKYQELSDHWYIFFGFKWILTHSQYLAQLIIT
jgi:hypothetical protein